jgi:lysozyme family protein
MNSSFGSALAFTLKWEGGFEGMSDDPTDRGGRTRAGITQIAFDAWLRGMNATPGRDVWTITPDEVESIYLQNYWTPCRCDPLPEKLDLCVFDAAVNHGNRKAIQFLQRAAGVVDDGVFGPQTMRAVDQDQSPERMQQLLASYCLARDKYYAAIVANDPRQVRFLKGWRNRLTDLRITIGVDVV